jgi:hypothetical protein
MAEGFQSHRPGRRRVGDDDVEIVDRERGQQLRWRFLATDHHDGGNHSERRLEQTERHELRNDVSHADDEAWYTRRGPAADRVAELAAEREDLVRIAIHNLADLRQDETPA